MMNDETMKRLPKELNMLKNRNSLLKEPTGLTDDYAQTGIGMLDIFKLMGKDRYSLPSVEDIQKRIDDLITEENTDPTLIEHLEEMKTAAEIQSQADIDPEEIEGYKSIHDIVMEEHAAISHNLRTLSSDSIEMIKEQIESDPGVFRSKYPELFDYMTELLEDY